jgi:hypothetical protein
MVLAGSLLAAGPAAAVEEWTPTETLTSPGVIASSPQLLAAADGTLTAAWTGTDGDIFNPHGLVIRTKPAGGTWSPEQVVDPDATVGLQIALDGDDRIVASYRGPRESSAYAITQAGDGSYGDPVALAPNLGGHIREFGAGPFLAVGDRGQQAVVWIQRIPGQGARVVAVRRDNTDAARLRGA